MSKFTYFETVLHIRTGNKYRIRNTPDNVRLASTGEPAYSYSSGDGIIWVRSQEEMEDGRFELVEQ